MGSFIEMRNIWLAMKLFSSLGNVKHKIISMLILKIQCFFGTVQCTSSTTINKIMTWKRMKKKEYQTKKFHYADGFKSSILFKQVNGLVGISLLKDSTWNKDTFALLSFIQ